VFVAVVVLSLIQDGWTESVRGVSCDEQTAILLTLDGKGRIVSQTSGSDHVCYFVQSTQAPSVCKPKTPLTFQALNVQRGTPNSTVFDFNTWSIVGGGASYTIGAVNGKLGSSQSGGSVY
jgi:cyanophycinase